MSEGRSALLVGGRYIQGCKEERKKNTRKT